MRMKLWRQGVSWFIIAVISCVTNGFSHEQRLHHDLFKNRNLTVHPTEGPVTVKLGLTLNQVLDVEEANEQVILNAWIRQEWMNPRLAWKMSEYDNISKINVQANFVWTPDLYIYANVEADKLYNGFLDSMKTSIIVNHDGRNSWLAPVIMRIGCTIKVKNFPFDTQNCSVKFGSFTYDMTRLKLIAESSSADFSKYTEHVEWKVLSMACIMEENVYPAEGRPHADVVYQLVIRRKPLFLLMNLLFPNFIFSFLTMVVYILPVSAGERCSFVVSLLLAMALFLTSAINLMPDSSEEIPFFSYFLGLSLLAMFFLTVCLCYTLSIHYANGLLIPLPRWMREYILERLTPYMGLEVRKEHTSWRQKLLELEGPTRVKKRQLNQELKPCHPGRLWRCQEADRVLSGECKRVGNRENVLTEKDILHISEVLSLIIEKIEQRDLVNRNQGEWHLVAKTLDALSFRVFLGAFSLIVFSCGVRLWTL